jgi:acyl-CoA thioester hydrolase
MSRPDPWRLSPDAYPFSFDVKTRWADLDALGHINNVAMAGLFEEGRGAFNRDMALHRDRRTERWLIAAVSLNYIAEAHHPHDVTVASGIGHIGTRSWVILSAAFQHGKCVATCDTTIVYTDETGAILVPDAFRAKMETVRVRG